MTVGLCTNLPSQCSKSARKEPIPMTGPDSRCPECTSRLQEIRNSTPGGRRTAILAAGAVIALAAVGAAAWFALAPAKRAAVVAAHPADIAAAPAAQPAAPPPPVIEPYLRLAGSNTIGSHLAPELIKAWLGTKGASDIREQGGPEDGQAADESLITASLAGKPLRVEVRAHGSATAFTELAAGTADIGMASRRIQDAEAASLARLGDMRGPASEHVLALDGIAVIVPASNPVAKLSRADLRRIFAGEARNWANFGGANHPITLYARDAKSGTFDTFKSLVLQGTELGAASRIEDSTALEAAVARDPDGIGFVGLPYVHTTRAIAISDGPAAALEPTRFTVKTESYPLSRRLYLYTPANPDKPATNDFIAFALSAAGQAVVRQVGFVDLDLSAAPSTEPPPAATACRLSSRWVGDPLAFCHLRDGAEQLGTSFRFETGSAKLDTRAIQDLRRVLDRMAQTSDKTLVLAGFADNSGSHAGNCALSRSRGKAVASALETLGLKPAEVLGFCDELPVRDNGSPEGRELNRRVDVFLR